MIKRELSQSNKHVNQKFDVNVKMKLRLASHVPEKYI